MTSEMRRLRIALPVGLLLSVSACGFTPESTEQTQEPVLNGVASGVEDNAVVKVIATQADMTMHTCTGTLIAPNLVLTARHCVVNSNALAFSCTSDGELVKGSPGGKLGAPVPPEDIESHAGPESKTPAAAVGAKMFSTDSTTTCRNDIAVMLLDREIAEIQPATLRLRTGVQRGESLSVVGYGWDEEGNAGVRRRRDGMEVIEVGASEFNPDPDLTPPRTFVAPGPVLCIGDSGGPAFGDQGEVVGVWSQVVGDCQNPDSRDVFTQVAPFEAAVLAPAFEAAGYEPLVAELPVVGEGGAPSTGAGGAPPDVGGTDTVGGTDAAAGTGEEPATAGSAGTGGSKPTRRKKVDSGCSTTPGGTGAPASLLGALLGLALAWRRRRG